MLRVNSHCTDVGGTQLGQHSYCSVQISKEERALYSNLSSDTLTRRCFSMLFSFSYCMRDKWRGLIPRPHSYNPTEIGVLVYVLSQIRHAVCTILFLQVVASTYTINTFPSPHHNTHTHTPHTLTAYTLLQSDSSTDDRNPHFYFSWTSEHDMDQLQPQR